MLRDVLEPSTKALLVAAGRRIYTWHEGRMEAIATRPGIVESLAYDGALFDAGRYKGVFLTAADKPEKGRFAQWQCIAGFEGRLYGVQRKGTDVHDLATNDIVRQRALPIDVLGTGDRLIDYSYHPHGSDIRDTLSNEVITSPFIPERYAALRLEGPWMLHASGRTVWRYFLERGEYPQRTEDLHQTACPFRQARDVLQDLATRFKDDTASRRRTWEAFCTFVQETPDMRGIFRRRMYQQSINLTLCDYRDALDLYAARFRIFRRYGQWTRKSDAINHVFNFALQYLDGRHSTANKATAFASLNGSLLVGTSAGRLEMATREEAHPPLWEFAAPIRSLISIPAEALDDGIRVKAARQKSLRHYFSRHQSSTALKRAA